MHPNTWDERYATTNYVYGTEPNDFAAAMAKRVPAAGPVLCLAEGEGRNAVFFAARGHPTTAIDASATGLLKAQALAAARGVTITTVPVDLAEYAIEPASWAGIIATWAHLPAPLRRQLHAQVVQGLQPGGVYILEAYTPAQLAFGTGGPKDPALCMTLADLRGELAGLEFIVGRECERDVREGTGHTGRGAVVQVCARRPAAPSLRTP
ncbi:MAG TPA: methyltransferase domain-containing protein [Opitutaceae bacterium]|nr:methyltransferase domain-containing protein [Opitutaceae bacterium]